MNRIINKLFVLIVLIILLAQIIIININKMVTLTKQELYNIIYKLGLPEKDRSDLYNYLLNISVIQEDIDIIKLDVNDIKLDIADIKSKIEDNKFHYYSTEAEWEVAQEEFDGDEISFIIETEEIKWGKMPPAPPVKAIKFEATGEQTVTLSDFTGLSLEYSYDGKTWNDFTEAVTFGTSEYPFVYVRGTNPNGFNWEHFIFGNNTSMVTLSGDILSLLSYEEEITQLPSEAFAYIFEECDALYDIKDLVFRLANSYQCYYETFYRCTNLVNVPSVLPAMELGEGCYSQMFYECESISSVPELPATTLADYCYDVMFYGCVALTKSPVLIASVLVTQCYYQMFANCSSLSEVTILATDISAENYLGGWLGNTAANGVIKCDASMVATFEADENTPAGWTVEAIS